MTTRLAVGTAFLFATSGLIFAAGPVGTISSAGAFELHGASVNPAGIPSWPISGGDEITTHISAAVVRLGNGSSATLASNSRARVESENGQVTLRLLTGSMTLNSADSGAVLFYNNSVRVRPGSQAPVTVSAGPRTNPVIGGPGNFRIKPVDLSGR